MFLVIMVLLLLLPILVQRQGHPTPKWERDKQGLAPPARMWPYPTGFL